MLPHHLDSSVRERYRDGGVQRERKGLVDVVETMSMMNLHIRGKVEMLQMLCAILPDINWIFLMLLILLQWNASLIASGQEFKKHVDHFSRNII